MSGYVCIAMLEDPPYNIYLAATEEEPEDWCARLPLPSHLLHSVPSKNTQTILAECLDRLHKIGLKPMPGKAFEAKPNVVLRILLDASSMTTQEGLILELAAKQPTSLSASGEPGMVYYDKAKNLPADSKDRVKLLKQAAEMGYKPAISYVIEAYEKGQHLKGGMDEAASWVVSNRLMSKDEMMGFSEELDPSSKGYAKLISAAEVAGFIDMDIGEQYFEQAQELELDDENRLALMKKAVEAGHSPAIEEVIEAYENGWGCKEGSLEEIYDWIVQNEIEIDNNRLYGLVIGCYPERESGRYSQFELEILSRLALAGHSKAMLQMARLYCDGLSVEQDCREAMRWVKKIKQEHLDMQDIYDLGCLYDDMARHYQDGTKAIIKDPHKAVKFFRKAAEYNYTLAYLPLSEAYLAGEGVRKDLNEALVWAKKALEAGSYCGYLAMARCYMQAGRKEQAADVWQRCFRECEIDKISSLLFAYALDVTKRGLPIVHTKEIAQRFNVAISDLEGMDSENYEMDGIRIYGDTIAWLEENKISTQT